MMDAVTRRANQWFENLKANKRARYKLARDLGFSSPEATILSGWSIKRIKKLAEDRGFIGKREE